MSERSIQEQIAQYAVDADFATLPDALVRWAKDVLVDSLGCAVVGHFSEPSRISRGVFAQLGGVAESTVIGSGMRVPCTSAAWMNGTMIRYEDLNDTYTRPGRIGHFSELIPTALAVGQRARSSGAEVLAAIVGGYEILAATTFHQQAGYGLLTFGAIAAPAVAGVLLGLSPEQISHAIGLSLSSNVTLATWFGDANASMLKASTWSSGAHHGILAALLAQGGYTGPGSAVETYIERAQVSHGFDTLVPGEFTVLDHNMLKGFAAQVLPAAAIEAVLALAQEHGLSPEGIDEIVVHCFAELVRSSAGPDAYRPLTREAADHSAPFLLALALVDGDVLPENYRRKPWEDPRLIALMGRIRFEVDEQLDARALAHGGFPVRVEIRARGEAFVAEREYPRGHAKNPMSSQEIRDKFGRLTRSYIDESRQAQIIEIADRLESEDSLEPLMASLVF